ncbi:MAG: hypothetical protein AAF438_02220 [Pseudomonadota bacterium]
MARGAKTHGSQAIDDRNFKDKEARANELQRQGVALADWMSLHVEGSLECGSGVKIGPHVVMEGSVRLADDVSIGPYVYLRDVKVGARTDVRAFSCLEDVEIDADCRVGPYARLRDGCFLSDNSSVGNFVEIKSSKIGPGARINHLSFIGDATFENRVTIGAGVITCNYDGEKNVPTVIRQGAFVGCGTELVAPIEIGQNATIAAGSTITEDVKAGGLTVARARQVHKDDWRR